MKIVGVYGFKKSGKTTVVTSIINALTRRGYSVSSAKSIHIENFSLETEGTDTSKHHASGAERVGLVYPTGKAILFYDNPNVEDFLNNFESDYLILEGFREYKCPKILCARNGEDLLKDLRDDVFCISGLVSNELADYKGIPVINNKEVDKIIEIIERL
ncbi:MAG: Molybdopterin guanine dinucleotide synthesis protein B [Candidatus Methanofastidiosum methylothiophilum]|uniref:Molybdopterin guanine dinucleotide synthesis protein B n=1 Tax=Candidatus Methanofastidiosum methylothiophilum TaxID=1705564 RepID=A0A150IPL4_9EURY|nr:MAG: Molybdopterin guanine dinucleotide synthesis protein B [Candidatus Methanofastidiosum methylthiophilus]KYC46989.1 MAG: Molybdopterin guanine dinucleotide synthesis protein B [Candidatus Methanofastidiosum methylthiophilus]KYC49642.1 MAG: Molybdopterin guanine dinucleotide synthesis protein B [Candidatus Methanofastidiosum methylthiophilus]